MVNGTSASSARAAHGAAVRVRPLGRAQVGRDFRGVKDPLAVRFVGSQALMIIKVNAVSSAGYEPVNESAFSQW